MARRTKQIAAFCVLVTLAIPLLSGLVLAQNNEESFTGTLRADAEDGDKVAVEGVTIRLIDANANEVGTAVSDADGTWNVAANGPGAYVVEIVVDTFPDGISLKNPDQTQRPLTLAVGQSRSVLFQLNEGAGAQQAGRSSFIDRFLRLSVEGLKFGLIIAMASIGLSLIYGTTGLTNFAHGEMVTFGALMVLLLNDPDVYGVHVLIAIPIGVLLTAGSGAVQELVLWRPLRNRGTGLIAMLVVSIGLSILVRYVFLYQAGGRNVRFREYSLQTDGINLGPVTIVPRDIWVMGISIVVLVTIAIGVTVTRLGKAMRAVSDNRDLAESSGIDVQRVILMVWVIGGGLAGLGGALMGLDQGASWDMGFELLLLMFAAVTLGGLGTAYGPLVGGLVIGLLVNVSTIWVAPELKNVGALFVLIVILLVRPQGLLGRAERIG